MGKGARIRSQRSREAIKNKRLKCTLAWTKAKLEHTDFEEDLSEAQREIKRFSEWLGLLNRDELRAEAARRDIKGRGSMNKRQLLDAIVKDEGEKWLAA